MAIIYSALTLFWWQQPVASLTPTPAPATDSQALLPIVLSSIAIFISVLSLAFNSYYQYFKRPETRLLLADELHAWLSPKGELIFNTTVTIFNEGARYGAISRMVGTVKSFRNSNSIPFRWRMFIDHKNVGEEGTRFTPHLAFAGWAHAIVIPARQALARHVQFVTREPFPLEPDIYTFEFLGFLGDLDEPCARAQMVIDLTEGQVSELHKAVSDPDTKVAKTSVRLARRLESKLW